MSKEDIVFSSRGFSSPMEVVDIKCSIENVVDRSWLFNNMPWTNHDNKKALLILDKVGIIYYYDRLKYEIKIITFDKVSVITTHGFPGNSYSFTFQLGGKVLHHPKKLDFMSLAEDEVIQKAKDHAIFMLSVHKKESNRLLNELLQLNQKEDE